MATDLKKEIDAIGDLLTLPDVVARINSLVRDPETSAADITRVISNDIALSAKVLKLVNSPFYGFNRRITSINYAIVILGFNAIRNLALSAFMYDVYRNSGALFDTKEFWRFSVCVAASSQALAKKLGFEGTDDAFMGGLLHEVGLVIMSQYMKRDFQQVIEKVQQDDILVIDAEISLLDYTHFEVGALLLDRWNLPEDIINVCREYFEPNEKSSELSAIVHVAHVMCRAMLLGNPGDRQLPELSAKALGLLKIPADKLGEYVAVVLKAAKKVESFMSMD